MQDNKELLLVFRIRPQNSGVLDLIPAFQKKSNTLLHVSFPESSSVIYGAMSDK